MLASLTLLLVLQLIGEVLVQWLGLPVPGPVVGMALLFAALMARGETPAPLRETANTLLQHLSLLFVPAGAGIMVHASLLAREWLPTLAAVVLSCAITLLLTAAVLRLGARGR